MNYRIEGGSLPVVIISLNLTPVRLLTASPVQ